MQHTLVFYLLVELLGSIFYFWRSWLWHGWKAIGSEGFSDSPDASFLYSSALSGYFLAQGVMLGLLLGSIAIAVLTSSSQKVSINRSLPILRISVVLLPIFVLLCGYLDDSRL